MKISINELRQMILEQDEEEPVTMANATGKIRLSLDSVDDQIDSHLLDFENASIVSSEEIVMESLNRLNLSALLVEQEDEGVEVGDVSVEPPAGSEDVEVEEPIEPAKKSAMNIDVFTKKVAQLALPYIPDRDNGRLDISTVIINRSINFLNENYDKKYVDSFKEILDTQFDFNIAPQRAPVTPLAGGRPAALGAFGEPEGLPATGGGGGD